MQEVTTNNEQWDLTIRPKKNLFDINLQELWKYRDLIMLFVRGDFVAKYKQSILGLLWFIIQPMLTTIMFVVIFSKVAGISTNGIPPVLFYMTGLVIWNYFSATLISTSDTFLANAGIFGKVYFPRLATPVSIVISNLIQFGMQFSFLIAIIIYYFFKDFSFVFSAKLLLIPFLILI